MSETIIINTRASKELKRAIRVVAAKSGSNMSTWLLSLINAHPEIKKELKSTKQQK